MKLPHDEIIRDSITERWIFHTMKLPTMKLSKGEITHDDITDDEITARCNYRTMKLPISYYE